MMRAVAVVLVLLALTGCQGFGTTGVLDVFNIIKVVGG
jgi:hypothetical protein